MSLSAEAQFWSTSSDDYNIYPVGVHLDIGALYIGGNARVAIEYPLKTVKKSSITDMNHRKEVMVQTLFVPSILYINKPKGFQAGLLDGSFLWRSKNERGLFIEYGIGVGLGYFAGTDSFIHGERGRWPAGLFGTPSLTLGFGSDLLSTKDEKPWLWSIRAQVPFVYPSNDKGTLIPIIQLGVTRYFPKKWEREQRYIKRSRATPR
jgi:hypothetical protein